MMMILGMFVFGLSTLPYQEFQRQMAWRFPEGPRVGERPVLQFTGPEADTISLIGLLSPEISGGDLSLALIEAMANEGASWPLIEGSGTYYGDYVITSIATTRRLFFADGKARQIEFTLSLKRAGSDQAAGQLTDALMALL